MKIKSALLIFLFLLFACSPPAQAQKERPTDFMEFEELVAGPMPLLRDRTFVPDYRRTHLEHAKRFEAFLDKYPDSPLRPEALIRTARIYLNVERPEIHMLRQQLFFCQASAMQLSQPLRIELCQQRYMLSVMDADGASDPYYTDLAKQILNQLVELYPRAKRYIILKPGVGVFSFVEEEIGAFALYLLASVALPEDVVKIYSIILNEYKISPELRREIENRLGH
ncbi:MAG: hypothetical protein Q8R12_01585 [bacterium]|nr:hypothetical protein [bacterium]